MGNFLIILKKLESSEELILLGEKGREVRQTNRPNEKGERDTLKDIEKSEIFSYADIFTKFSSIDYLFIYSIMRSSTVFQGILRCEVSL